MKNIDSQGLVADLCVGMLISLSPDTLSVDERAWFSFVVFKKKKAITGYVKGQFRSRKTNKSLCRILWNTYQRVEEAEGHQDTCLPFLISVFPGEDGKEGEHRKLEE